MRTLRRLLVLQIFLGGLSADAQPTMGSAVRSAGNGPVSWVLITGLMGSIGGFHALETALCQDGSRVVTIDPYLLSLDSADVSFDALARRVRVVLDAQGVRHARLVGHANGAGVALRVAAFEPDRVASLFLLDAGALASGRGKVLSRMLRLVPLIAKLPGGRSYLRAKLVAGVRENTRQREWFDDATQHAYVDPILDGIGAATALVVRVGAATEPEALSHVVFRVHAPVTVILGGAPHPSEAGREELNALRPLGARLEVVRLADVGHFPHEEATALVTHHLRRRANVSAAAVMPCTPPSGTGAC